MNSNRYKKLFLLLACFATGILTAGAQIITTVAGTDSLGYSGDHGFGRTAILKHPFAIVIDKKGNLYFSEPDNNAIRMLAPDANRIITTFAGGPHRGYKNGASDTAYMDGPTDLAIDAIGNIYFTDANNGVIRKIDTSAKHIITTVAGRQGVTGFFGDGGPATNAFLNKPSMTVDSLGNIYIADTKNHRIRMVTASDGKINTIAGTGGTDHTIDSTHALVAQISPMTIAISPESGILFFTDQISTQYRVIKFLDGTSANRVRTYQNTWGLDMTFNKFGDLYFSDASCSIKRVHPNASATTYAGVGYCGYSGDSGLSYHAQLQGPNGIAFDSAMNLYVAEAGGSRIRMISYDPQTVAQAPVTNNGLSVFPNPATGSFTIMMPATAENGIITVCDMSGRIVLTRTVAAGEQKAQVDASRFAPGLYMVRVATGDKLYREKVIIR